MSTRPSVLVLLLVAAAFASPLAAQSFGDATTAAGLSGVYLPAPINNSVKILTGGMAVADYDGDGWDDVFWLAGATQPNRLYRNDGDGTFTDVAPQVGLDLAFPGCSAHWADYDGDGDLDLFVSSLENLGPPAAIAGGGGAGPKTLFPGSGNNGSPPGGLGVGQQYRNFLFRNDGGTFVDVALAAGVRQTGRWGQALGDIDGDGWLDLVGLSWNGAGNETAVMRNNGNGTFRRVTPAAMKGAASTWGFTPRIVDYDLDGDADLMLVQDIVNTHVWRNDGSWQFTDVSDMVDVTNVQNGMGTAVGDINNDGKLDWFITSIYSTVPLVNEFWGTTGNRLYLNGGNGTFADITDLAGVRDGGWGWGAQMEDLNHDGRLDIVMVNGYPGPPINPFPMFQTDTLKIFMNNGGLSFSEQAETLGILDTDEGRGVAVVDFDRDGALDILVSNNNVIAANRGLTLYRGDPGAITGTWIEVELDGAAPNTRALGARITANAAGLPQQLRVMEAGNNYLSQAPARVRFGLGSAASVDLTVRWPDGTVVAYPGQAVNQRVVLAQP